MTIKKGNGDGHVERTAGDNKQKGNGDGHVERTAGDNKQKGNGDGHVERRLVTINKKVMVMGM